MEVATESTDMVDLNDRDKEVLSALAEGRANPMLLRVETDLDKGDVNTVLVKLTRDGLVKRVVQGLYEITDEGLEKVNDNDTE